MLWVPPPAHTRGTRPTHTCTDGERGGAPTPPWGARLPTGRVCPPHQLPPPRSEAPRQTRGRPTPGATRARPALSAGAVGGLRPPAATPLPAPVGARQRWIRNRRGEPSLRPTARWDRHAPHAERRDAAGRRSAGAWAPSARCGAASTPRAPHSAIGGAVPGRDDYADASRRARVQPMICHPASAAGSSRRARSANHRCGGSQQDGDHTRCVRILMSALNWA